MNVRKSVITGLLLALLFVGMLPLCAQTIDDNITITASGSTRISEERAAYIMINSHYPLVPGDTFELKYAQRGEEVILPFFVEENYSVNLTYMGKLNVEGMTFSDLKNKVEELVESSFPGSYAQLIIRSPGTFMIPLKGEVKSSVEIPAWGFMKLSEAIKNHETPYSSIRRVEVLSREGESRFYDLYTALRYGEKNDDPFLRVGDTIILHKYDRHVKVDGQVRRPGTYELLPEDDLRSVLLNQADGFSPRADTGTLMVVRAPNELSPEGETIYISRNDGIVENLSLLDMDVIQVPTADAFLYTRKVTVSGEVRKAGTYTLRPGEDLLSLIEHQADGFSPQADLSRVTLHRYLSETSAYGEAIYLDFSGGVPEGFDLTDLDRFSIPRLSAFQPKVLFQGAVSLSGGELTETEASIGLSVSNKLPVTITPGERLSSVVMRVQSRFTLSSDLENALLTRKGLARPMEINLQNLLLNPAPENDPVIEDQDIIVIPFRQYQVFVGGQVNSPGAFPYIPNRTWEYYVGLAGGFNIDTHIGTKLRISDVYGEKHKQEERFIQPEDVLYAPANHPLYWIGEYGTEMALIASAITSTVMLINWIGDVASDSFTYVPLPDDGTTSDE